MIYLYIYQYLNIYKIIYQILQQYANILIQSFLNNKNKIS
jgi:hypothetical protein